MQNELEYWNAPNKIKTNQMELPSQFSEQIVFNTSRKIEEHMLIVMDKSTN